MAIERTALRLAAVMALTNGFAAPYPTIAANRVFDSRVDPLEGLKRRDLVPIAIVYTDDDEGETLSHNNGGPPFRHLVSLVFGLSIGMVGDLEDADGNPLKDEDGNAITGLLPIATEPELEAMLDLFEDQVERIFRHPVNAWAARLSPVHDPQILLRVESWKSVRFVEREGQARLAARQITARVMLPQPEEPAIVSAPVTAPPIPEPLGSLLAAIVAAGGPYAPSAEALQNLMTVNGGFGPLVLPPLQRVRLKEANLGGGNLTGTGPARPDGVAEVALPQD